MTIKGVFNLINCIKLTILSPFILVVVLIILLSIILVNIITMVNYVFRFIGLIRHWELKDFKEDYNEIISDLSKEDIYTKTRDLIRRALSRFKYSK